ncbi:2-isopropylmalate synthase [Psychrilyobacter sp.]|uniref:2-isopropylmalate synthase n=1 Tax=Psychrilyobacter sp. TaxID=2586924 RepID=UPI003018DFE7
MEKMIKIFDTTLRDGEQSPGCSMNIGEKIEVARQLEKLGVDIIEAGFPASSKGDFNSVKAIAESVTNVRVAGLARALKGDIDTTWEAIKGAKYPRIHTFIATSDIHMKYKLKKTPEEVYKQAVEMIKYAKSKCDDIEFSAEDATRTRPEFLYKIVEGAIEAGATVINIPDTVGYTTPEEFYKIIKGVRENVKNINMVDISVHCHNDLGLGVANSLAAVKAGATQVECTVNGIGERAGNAALEEVVMAMRVRKDIYPGENRINTEEIYKTSQLITRITGVEVQPNKAIVGENAFAHESGIHQHGMLENKETYEIMTPESIGLSQNKMVLGKHSGKHAFENHLIECGYELTREEIEEIFVRFKELADKKKDVSTEDIEALIYDTKIIEKTYTLNRYTVNTGNTITPIVSINMGRDGKIIENVAIGDGPVDAAFKAIDKIINVEFELNKYTIKAVTSGSDAQGEVFIRLGKDNKSYNGRHTSTDIVEASIMAYIGAINNYFDEQGRI